MSPGPAERDTNNRGRDEQSDDSFADNWRERTDPLGYEGRDIRIIFPEVASGNEDAPRPEPARFGDFDPNPEDPDPAVWPLDHFDPGAGEYDVDDLIRVGGTYPAPHVAWVTPEYIERVYGYDSQSPEIPDETIETLRREGRLSSGDGPSMDLTPDRVEFFDRLVRLWNGEEVRGVRLLDDRCASWDTLFGDLDQEELERLFVDPSSGGRLSEAFGDMPWYGDEQSVFLRQQYILRKPVKYAPTLKAKTLVNGREEFANFAGDPKEGLLHRVTVGLTAVYYALHGWRVWTYKPTGDYVVDVVAENEAGQVDFLEVITGHDNWELHRDTYAKLADLSTQGRSVTVFNSRGTAYDVINHWDRAGLGDLPVAPFNSDPSIDWGREKLQEAYADGDTDWIISDFLTTAWLWRNTFGDDDLDIDSGSLLSSGW